MGHTIKTNGNTSINAFEDIKISISKLNEMYYIYTFENDKNKPRRLTQNSNTKYIIVKALS